MSNTDSGWRKRQIALDIKAKNARELGLDYEPTVMDFAREAGAIEMRDNDSMGWGCEFELHQLEAFAALIRADERKKFLGALRQLHDSYSLQSDPSGLRARGQA
jgi:hypothetical protein